MQASLQHVNVTGPGSVCYAPYSSFLDISEDSRAMLGRAACVSRRRRQLVLQYKAFRNLCWYSKRCKDSTGPIITSILGMWKLSASGTIHYCSGDHFVDEIALMIVRDGGSGVYDSAIGIPVPTIFTIHQSIENFLNEKALQFRNICSC